MGKGGGREDPFGGQGGCERGSEAIVKIQKKKEFRGGGRGRVRGWGSGGSGCGGQGGCKRRIEVIVGSGPVGMGGDEVGLGLVEGEGVGW